MAKGHHATMETCKLTSYCNIVLTNALLWKVLIGSSNKHNVFHKSDFKGMVTRFLRDGTGCCLQSCFQNKLKMSLSIKFPQLCHKTDNKIQVVLHLFGRKLAICLKKKTTDIYTLSCMIGHDVMLSYNSSYMEEKNPFVSVLKVQKLKQICL